MNGSTNFPYNFSNVRGIPMIASSSIEVTADNVVVNIPNRAFRGLANSGVVAFKLTQDIPSGGEALPVIFSSSDFTQPLTVAGGANATGSSFSGIGVYLIWYDKSSNTLQLLMNV